jgi:hypothetical protein
MVKRVLDWLIGRREPDAQRLDEIERRLFALSLRVAVRTRGRQ